MYSRRASFEIFQLDDDDPRVKTSKDEDLPSTDCAPEHSQIPKDLLNSNILFTINILYLADSVLKF